MEKFKYRIWNKAEDIMYYPNNLDLEKWLVDMDGNLGCLNLSDMSWSGVIPKDFYEILPYTGFKDKNEKDIYEGDILTWDKFTNVDINIGFVSYKKGCFWIENGVKIMPRPLKAEEYSRLEVIGNIYENEKLLEV